MTFARLLEGRVRRIFACSWREPGHGEASHAATSTSSQRWNLAWSVQRAAIGGGKNARHHLNVARRHAKEHSGQADASDRVLSSRTGLKTSIAMDASITSTSCSTPLGMRTSYRPRSSIQASPRREAEAAARETYSVRRGDAWAGTRLPGSINRSSHSVVCAPSFNVRRTIPGSMSIGVASPFLLVRQPWCTPRRAKDGGGQGACGKGHRPQCAMDSSRRATGSSPSGSTSSAASRA